MVEDRVTKEDEILIGKLGFTAQKLRESAYLYFELSCEECVADAIRKADVDVFGWTIQQALQTQIIMLMGILTDSASTKSNENASLKRLSLRRYQASLAKDSRIQEFIDIANVVREARDKVYAHSDMSVHSGTVCSPNEMLDASKLVDKIIADFWLDLSGSDYLCSKPMSNEQFRVILDSLKSIK